VANARCLELGSTVRGREEVRGGVGHAGGSGEGEAQGDLALMMALPEDKARWWWRTWMRPWAAVSREPWARWAVWQQCGAHSRECRLVHARMVARGHWLGGPFCRAGLGLVQIGGGPALFKWVSLGNLIKWFFPK
jgi:hypothetical protein